MAGYAQPARKQGHEAPYRDWENPGASRIQSVRPASSTSSAPKECYLRHSAASPSKKAQMELMGLAIVVILLSLAFLFVVRFVILNEPADARQSFQESELAANFLNTMLETNAPECSDATMAALIQDCANYYDLQGRITCQSQGSNLQSCEFLKFAHQDLFARTFETWKVKYYFEVYRNPQSPSTSRLTLLTQGQACTGNRRLKVQPLPVAGSTIYLGLHICS
ncbi:hypothetical protein J4419_01495 [Candidatus Woesearchaeota archaeon]|nr:hypothetical protein [Candidatus Woesearchaeota archaeon]